MKCINYNIDYLRIGSKHVILDQKLANMFNGMSDNANSGFMELHGFEFRTQFFTSRGDRMLKLSYKDFEVIQVKNYAQPFGSLEYSITFYGMFFKFVELKKLLINFCSRFKETSYVSRIDVCSDYTISTNQLLRCSKNKKLRAVRTNFKKQKTEWNGNSVESHYFGTRNTKRYFVRVYDKLKELKAHGKTLPYADYFLYKNVTRVETQFNIEGVKRFGIDLDAVILFMENNKETAIQKSYYTTIKNKKAVNLLKLRPVFIADGIQKTVKKDISQSRLLDNLDYAKRMMGYVLRLDKQGFDVISYITEQLEYSKVKDDFFDKGGDFD